MVEFKVGDTVRLRSGGPLMTVTGVGRDDKGAQKVWTSWFSDKKEEKGFYSNAAALEVDDGSVSIA